MTGGTKGDGIVFSIGTNGSGFKSLFSFDGTDGDNAQGNLTLVGPTLYGMTLQGGPDGDGNIFSINTNGSDFQDLLDFDGTNGKIPGQA